MESKDELKEIDIKNLMCYYFNDITVYTWLYVYDCIYMI